jgi:hypothetical protein
MSTQPPSGATSGHPPTLEATRAAQLEELATKASAASTAAAEASFAAVLEAARSSRGVLKMAPNRPITGA